MTQTGAVPQTVEDWTAYLATQESVSTVLPDSPESFQGLLACCEQTDVETGDYEPFEDLIPRLVTVTGAQSTITRTVFDTYQHGPSSSWLPKMVRTFADPLVLSPDSLPGTRTDQRWWADTLAKLKPVPSPVDMGEMEALHSAYTEAVTDPITPSDLRMAVTAEVLINRMVMGTFRGGPTSDWFTWSLAGIGL